MYCTPDQIMTIMNLWSYAIYTATALSYVRTAVLIKNTLVIFIMYRIVMIFEQISSVTFGLHHVDHT